LINELTVKAPAVGIDLKNEPSTLQSPSATISCVASTIFPVAGNEIEGDKCQKLSRDSQNALAIAMLAKIETIGKRMKPDPISDAISINSIVLLPS
jgi:hypothetical protein